MPKWGILWRSCNELGGKQEHLLGRFGWNQEIVPPYLAGYTKIVFATREEARRYIKARFGYIAERPDLRREPHGWKMPTPVKVAVEVKRV